MSAATLMRPDEESDRTAEADGQRESCWTRLDQITAPLIDRLRGELAIEERAVNGDFDLTASLRMDRLIIQIEAEEVKAQRLQNARQVLVSVVQRVADLKNEALAGRAP